MKVCIIGDFSKNLDEGFKNIAFHIAEEESKYNEILRLDIKNIFSIYFWKTVKNADVPMIIHYLTSPSLESLIVLKVLKLYWRNRPITIISALFPNYSFFLRKFIILFKPDLILVQSNESNKIFSRLGCATRVLPNGVDIEKFTPVSQNIKVLLRENYGIDKKKFVVLHVGHIKKDRNLQIFEMVQNKENQIVIIGSNYIEVDKNLYQQLKKIGCRINLGYFKNIEESYALSDCYIFPVTKGSTIISPLSVFEAMSCNLPVVTRRFDGLTENFTEGDGLIYAEKDEDFINAIEMIKKGIDVRTREKVMIYSWKNIGMKLNQIYRELIYD